MRILFDRHSVQVHMQRETKTRLNTLLGAIHSAGVTLNDRWTVSYSAQRITPAQLAGAHVLVVLTRSPKPGHAYAQHELDAIAEYVEGGGGLLLMTSHPPEGANDVALAARFGIELRPVFVSNPTVGRLALDSMVMSGRHLDPSHAHDVLFQVTSLVSHDSCEIAAPRDAVRIATFPPAAIRSPGGDRPRDKAFAIAVRRGAGKVIVVGNSGIVCDYGSPQPSCGLVPMGSNLLFFLNCIRYLAGLPTPAYPGLCPGQTAASVAAAAQQPATGSPRRAPAPRTPSAGKRKRATSS